MNVFIHSCFSGLFRDHPIVLADVGARGGLKKNWRAARRHLQVLGFEPDRQEYARLVARHQGQAHADTLFNVALHNRTGSVTLHVARDAGLSSIFEPDREFLRSFPNADRFDTVDRRLVDIDTLDHVLEVQGVGDLDFIKVDTQGSELLVLEGAAKVLETSVTGVEVEAEFVAIYKGQPLFADVDRYLRDLGYFLFDLRPCYWKREAGQAVGGPYGQIIWGDALYLKSVPALRQMLAALDAGARKSKLLKAVSIALLYGYVDYALEMAHDHADVWTAEERKAIDGALDANGASRATPKVPGRRQLATALHRLAKHVREPNSAWSISDPDLGNPPR